MIGWIRPSDASNRKAVSGAVKPPATREDLFLRRLNRLIALSERPGLDALQRRQVNYALYSTYWDCVGLGMRARATTLLELPPQQRSLVIR